ncbi:hypothetical protein GCM10007164_25320 [Luteimonas padinae]|uniref:Secreted protein n=1 Tax=Luteimonas padinae TaxID=1714359 RepID=A0ABV6SSG6_9GAMM|nr:hypothetical protein [Luteimonas padinae]GHD74544.1 hypothetical protein GCM10007164_25320 [Luteimonas padinae]
MRRIIPSASIALLALLLAACSAAQPGGSVQAPPMSDPQPATPMPAQPARPAVSGVPDLDRSCRVDSDCAVKDVGSCCGYSPSCVNTAAQPDPKAVQAACADAGMAGVCGFREIEACACVSNTCEPAQSGGAVAR